MLPPYPDTDMEALPSVHFLNDVTLEVRLGARHAKHVRDTNGELPEDTLQAEDCEKADTDDTASEVRSSNSEQSNNEPKASSDSDSNPTASVTSDTEDDVTDDQGNGVPDLSEAMRRYSAAVIRSLSSPHRTDDHRQYAIRQPSRSVSDGCIIPMVTLTGVSSSSDSESNTSTDDIEAVRSVTSRLRLKTRRPSVMEWQQRYILNKQSPSSTRKHVLAAPAFDAVPEEAARTPTNASHSRKPEWTSERKELIDKALEKLRDDLISLKEQDAQLARTFLTLRRELELVRLQRSTEAHRRLLQEAIEIEEEKYDYPGLQQHSDHPPDQFPPDLKPYGLTPLNLNQRRFSVL